MSSGRTSTCGQFLLIMAIALAGCTGPQKASPTLSSPTPTSTPPVATRQPTVTPTLSPPTPTSVPMMATHPTTEERPVLMYDEWPSDGFPSDPAQVTVTDLENNILTIKVIYYGGCRHAHTFELYAWTAFLSSDPPQGMLNLS